MKYKLILAILSFYMSFQSLYGVGFDLEDEQDVRHLVRLIPEDAAFDRPITVSWTNTRGCIPIRFYSITFTKGYLDEQTSLTQSIPQNNPIDVLTSLSEGRTKAALKVTPICCVFNTLRTVLAPLTLGMIFCLDGPCTWRIYPTNNSNESLCEVDLRPINATDAAVSAGLYNKNSVLIVDNN